jgi:hypothetical protein
LTAFSIAGSPARKTIVMSSSMSNFLGGPFSLARIGESARSSARCTPERLKEYLSSFDPHLRGLTGDLASIKDVARGYRVYFKKAALEGGGYTMDHSALVYLMDKEGRFVAPFNVKRTPEAAATDLRKYF